MSRELLEIDNYVKWGLIKNSSDDNVNLLYISYSTPFIFIKYMVF